jgi:hypothetical protein
MSGAVDVLAELSRRNVTVRVDGQTLRLRPRTAVDGDLLKRLREHKAEVLTLLKECAAPEWPPASLDSERRFGQPHAKLFPFLGRKVRTPSGPGTLIQVFAERATVLLDSQLHKCAWFTPEEIRPIGDTL